MGLLANSLTKKLLTEEKKEEIFVEITDKILSVTTPLAIICFGSLVDNTMTENSDIDIAVIFNDTHEYKTGKSLILNSKLFINWQIDLLFFPLDYYIIKSQIGGVCYEIKNRGKIIYGEIPKI